MENRSKKLIFAFMCVFLAATMIIGSVLAETPNKALLGDPAPGEDPIAGWDMEQIVMNKYATDNGDGSFKLTIETYAAGEVTYTTTTSSQPADIVVLLDVSSSMESNRMEDLSGGTSKRSTVAKQALQTFIADIAEKYSSSADYRMSIVTFGSTARQLNTDQAWYELDATGASALSRLVGNYDSFSSGTTNQTVGLEKAKDLLNMTYSGANTDRKKIVVLFTDGVPAGSGSSYTRSYADNGVKAALDLKNSGVEIFCVGIYNGANSSVIRATSAVYGRQYNYTYNSDGSVKSWQARSGTIFRDDSAEELYAPLGNRFLNFVSSNYPTASSCDVEYTTGGGFGILIPTTYNFTVTSTTPDPQRISYDEEYFYAASNAAQIDEAFARISELVAQGGTTIDLEEEAEIRDIISDYFNLKPGTTVNDIVTYTRLCTGGTVVTDEHGQPEYTEKGHIKMNYTFGDAVLTSDPASPVDKDDIKVIITDYADDGDCKNITVNGFNFKENYVAYDTAAGKSHGLLFGITFDIVPIEGFNGGNKVPTNGVASGIYLPGETYPLKPYNQPDVSVETKKPECKLTFPTDIVLYKGNSVSFSDILDADEGTAVTDAFVKRTIKYNGVVIENGIFTPDHTTYFGPNSLEVTLEPIVSEGSEVGTLAEKVTGTNDKGFTIYVLEPTVSVGLQDTTGVYGEEYTLGTGETPLYNVVWAEPENDVNKGTLKVEADATTVGLENDKPFGTEDDPADEFELHYSAPGEDDNKIVLPKAGATVTAEVFFKADGITPVTDFATVVYETKNAAGTEVTATDGTYKVTAETCSLTVTNDGGNADEVFFYNIYKDGDLYTTLSVNGDSSATIKDLPVGVYKAEANTDWAWKYTSEFDGDTDTVTLSGTSKTGELSCEYTFKGSNWFSDVSTLIKNIFGEGGN